MSLLTYGLGQGGGGTAPVGPPALPSYSWTVIPNPELIATPNPGYLDLTFVLSLQTVSLEAAQTEFWTFSGGTIPLVCSGIAQPNINTIRLFHNEPKIGQTYTLHFPANGIKDVYGTIYNGPSTINFVSVANPPTITMIQSINNKTLRIIFSESVIPGDATNINNYAVSPSLTILSSTKETDRNYILTTSAQVPGTLYTVTVSNVRDLSQNET